MFGRRRAKPPTTPSAGQRNDLDEYTRSVAPDLRKRRGGDRGGLRAGQYEGLLSTDIARLAPRAGETEKHLSGYLVGHLIRWMHTRGRDLDTTIVLAGLYAAAAGHAEFRRAMAKEDGLFMAHLYAAITAEKKTKAALPEADERMVFAWLCEQADLPITPAMVTRLERIRAKRHARYGLDQV